MWSDNPRINLHGKEEKERRRKRETCTHTIMIIIITNEKKNHNNQMLCLFLKLVLVSVYNWLGIRCWMAFLAVEDHPVHFIPPRGRDTCVL